MGAEQLIEKLKGESAIPNAFLGNTSVLKLRKKRVQGIRYN